MKRKRDIIDFTDDIIHVKCDGSDKLTHVHRSLLLSPSSPLQDLDACAGIFDPNTNTFDVSDFAQHDSFQLIVHWLYTGEIVLAEEGSKPVSTVAMLLYAYHAAYALAIDWNEQHQCSLSNAIMDHVVDRFIRPEKHGAAITVETLLEVPKGLQGPPARFISDWLVRGNLTPNPRSWQFVHVLDIGLRNRLLQLFFEQMQAGNGKPPWEKDPCAYHLHFRGFKRCQARA
ncbi:hypothetical protein NU219Hw_g8912t1 [Hortaea werneckii]